MSSASGPEVGTSGQMSMFSRGSSKLRSAVSGFSIMRSRSEEFFMAARFQ